MQKQIKVFDNGRSRAIRLPKNLGFNDCKVLYIEFDEKTGNLILSKKPKTWGDFFDKYEQKDIPQDYMVDRDQPKLSDKELF